MMLSFYFMVPIHPKFLMLGNYFMVQYTQNFNVRFFFNVSNTSKILMLDFFCGYQWYWQLGLSSGPALSIKVGLTLRKRGLVKLISGAGLQ